MKLNRLLYPLCWCIAAFFETLKCPLVWIAGAFICLGLWAQCVEPQETVYQKLDRIEQKLDSLVELGAKWEDY